jgi:hypothetical protein
MQLIIKKFKKFLHLSKQEKRFFIEAYMILGMMWTMLFFISVKKLAQSSENGTKKSEFEKPDAKQLKTSLSIGKAITQAAAYTPWKSTCLIQSLTAQNMLQKRDISGIFYLGIAKDKTNRKNIRAHAWSQCGEMIITGDLGHEDFTPLLDFKW